MDMYRFDRKLRLLLFNEIEKIEVAIRSCITNAVSVYFNDLFCASEISTSPLKVFLFRIAKLY